MPVNTTYPGVYIDELPSAVRTIVGVSTAVTAFVGTALQGPTNDPQHITSWADFEQLFGGLYTKSEMSYAVYYFYLNGGSDAEIVRVGSDPAAASLDLGNGVTLAARTPGAAGNSLRARVTYPVPDDQTWTLTVKDTSTGFIEAYPRISKVPASARSLDKMLAASRLVTSTGALDQRPPKSTDPANKADDPFADPAAGAAPTFVQGQGGADVTVTDDQFRGSQAGKTGVWALLKTDIFNILCIPSIAPEKEFTTALDAASALCYQRRAVLLVDPPSGWTAVNAAVDGAASPPVTGYLASNAALYFPRVKAPDPLAAGPPREFPPCGVMAGIYARTDAQRGVWKAPAGTDASLNGVSDLAVHLTDPENGELNPLGVSCLRSFPLIGPVAWGARTLRGADELADQWKYVPVRRTALYIEESLYRGTKWVVFEPNDEPLWSAIRLNVGAFMNTLFRQGAFQGSTPSAAYLVKCDKENNPQNDIDRGIVNILVGFAPLKPAEFVIIHIEQLAGQLAT